MTYPKPQVFTDYEILLKCGERVYVTVLEGRDEVQDLHDGRMVVRVFPEPGVVVEHAVNGSEVVYCQTRRYEVQPDVHLEDAGSTRTVGEAVQ